MKRQKGSKGFTLVEVIVVLVILAVLAAILIPTYTGYIRKTEKTKCAVQRGDLEKKFIAMYNYDPKIRSCTTAADVTQITGDNVADYMLQNGYYEGETKCPVYDQNYEFKLVPSGAGYRGEFTCGCVDEFSKFEAAVKKAAESLNNSQKDSELIKNVYNSYGSLPKVSDAELASAGFAGGKPMYWRPYQLGNGNIIYFANSAPYSDGNPQGSWNAGIVKVNGVIYATKDQSGTGLSDAFHYKGKDLDDFVNDYLIQKGFKKK